MIDQTLVVLLQAIREHFGKPVTITSGYRTAATTPPWVEPRAATHLLGRGGGHPRWQGVPVEDVAATQTEPCWPGLGRRGPRIRSRLDSTKGWCMWTPAAKKSRWTM